MLVDGYVHPELTGRGVGAELLRLTEARAHEELESVPPGERAYLQNAALVNDPAVPSLYAAHGYHAERHFWRMVIDLERAPEPRVPAGIAVRLLHDPDERHVLYETLEEAFADHWEHRLRDFEEWSQSVFGVEGYDPTLVWVALEGEDVVAGNVCWWKRHGEWGWVGTLGVRPHWRRRGIAEALRPTGATRLYEKAGMRVFWEAVVYEKELRPAGA